MELHKMAPLRRASRRFAWVIALLILLLVIPVAMSIFESSKVPAKARSDIYLLTGIGLLPAVFQFWALASLWRAFNSIAKGALFEPTVGRGLGQFGWALMGSGISSGLIVPLLSLPIVRRGIEAGFIERGRYAYELESADILLLLLGPAMLLVARLLRVAAEVRAHNEELRNELDSFA